LSKRIRENKNNRVLLESLPHVVSNMKYMSNMHAYAELNSHVEDVNRQISTIASVGGLFLALGACITLSIMTPFTLIHIVSIMCLINSIFSVFIAERFFGYKIKKWADIFSVIFLMLTMPIQWFFTGGFHGIGGMWCIFAAILCLYSLKGRIQQYLLILFAPEVVSILVLNIIHPEWEVILNTKQSAVICFVSTLGIGCYVQFVEMLQNIQFMKAQESLQNVQREMAVQYEKSLETNEELTDLTKKLEMSNKTQRSFTAAMNHEMRAPLNGIEGCLQILMMDDSLSHDARETVKNALTASMSINQTINDLLDFSMLEQGKFEIVRKPFDLRDTIDNISTIFKPMANAKNLKFIINIPMDTRVSLYADGVRIQQVITNLISNSVKYTKEGSVSMIFTTKRGNLHFEINDTGVGMDEASLAVLFDPFTRFNMTENVNIQGTGLGMNIVYNMVKAMKGDVRVESEVGVGTTFYVDIPIMFYDSEILYSTPRDTDSKDFVQKDLSIYKVLCVDDTEINRTVFKGMLKKTNTYVVMADNGEQAIELCKKQKFDIIFMDHIMPGIDGVEATKKIRELPGGRFDKTPIVMFTGNSSEEYKKLYIENGANGYLLKPIMYDELIQCFNLIEEQE